MSKRAIQLLKWAVLAAVVAGLAGCSLLGETMEDRIKSFVDSINSGSGVQNSLDGGASDYNTANTSTFWVQYFEDYGSGGYSVSGVSEGGSSATATISGGEYSGGATFTFEFTEEGGLLGSTYKIRRIYYGSFTVFK